MALDFDQFGKNCNTAKMLNTYLESSQTEYAVLLTGAWGSGKTFFIQQFIEQLKLDILRSNTTAIAGKELKQKEDTRVFCYISLFDTKNYTDIDKSIMAQANPYLNSEKVKNLGRFSNFLIDKGINSTIPAEYAETAKKAKNLALSFFKGFLEKFPEELVIILDDLERSSIPPKEILGYANSLLTSNKAKVILLADEEIFSKAQIKNEEKEQNNENTEIDLNSFKTIKEKVIGKTVYVISDVSNVYDSYVKEIEDATIREYLDNNKENLLKIYEEYEFKNLRILKYFLNEAEVFLQFVKNISNPENYLLDEFVTNLLESLFFLSFFVLSGKVKAENLVSYQWSFLQDDKRSEYERKVDYKLGSFLVNDRDVLWQDYFLGKYIYQEVIDKILPMYTNSWEGVRIIPYKLQEEEFYTAYEKLNKRIAEKKITNPAMILEVFTQKLYYSELGIINEDYEAIMKEYLDYISAVNLDKAGSSSIYDNRYDYLDQRINKLPSEYHDKMYEKMNEIMDSKYEEDYKKFGKDLILTMSNQNKFNELIKYLISKCKNFNSSYIDVNDFLNELIKVSPPNEILWAMVELSNSYNFRYTDEARTLAWWEALYKELHEGSYSNYNKKVINALLQNIKITNHKFSWQQDTSKTSSEKVDANEEK